MLKEMAIPTLLCRSEAWIMNKKGIMKIQSTEIEFLRSVKGYTRMGKIRNYEI
jgi:hypothetical protein